MTPHTPVRYIGLLFDDGACVFEEDHDTPAQRAEAMIKTMRSNHDEVEADELQKVLDEHADADPDTRLNEVYALYGEYASLDMHLMQVSVPIPPTTLFLTVTDHGDQMVAEAHTDEAARQQALAERVGSLAPAGITVDRDAPAAALAADLTRLLGEDLTRIGLLAVTCHGEHWRPSLEHETAVSSPPAQLPERLWVVTTDYGTGERSVEVSPSAAQHRQGVIDRLDDFRVNFDPDAHIDVLVEKLAMVLAPTGGTLFVDEMVRSGDSWVLGESA